MACFLVCVFSFEFALRRRLPSCETVEVFLKSRNFTEDTVVKQKSGLKLFNSLAFKTRLMHDLDHLRHFLTAALHHADVAHHFLDGGAYGAFSFSDDLLHIPLVQIDTLPLHGSKISTELIKTLTRDFIILVFCYHVVGTKT